MRRWRVFAEPVTYDMLTKWLLIYAKWSGIYIIRNECLHSHCKANILTHAYATVFCENAWIQTWSCGARLPFFFHIGTGKIGSRVLNSNVWFHYQLTIHQSPGVLMIINRGIY